MLLFIAVCLIRLTAALKEDVTKTCALQLRFTDGAGIGVFAGKDWSPGEQIELSIGVPVPLSVVYWTQLINYSEGFNDTHGLIATGFAMLYNHVLESDKVMVRKHMSHQLGKYKFRYHDTWSSDSSVVSTDILFEPNSVIFAGEQILNYYGDDWFVDRGQTEAISALGSTSNAPIKKTVADLNSTKSGVVIPGCPSSTIRFDQNKIFAAVDFEPGDIIEVARAILLPDWSFPGHGPLGELLWWGSSPNVHNRREQLLSQRQRIESQFPSPYTILPYNLTNSQYAMLLTGYGSFYSASTVTLPTDSDIQRTIKVRDPNVQYQWWQSSNGTIQCDLLMMVSFTTLTFIEEGEELVVDMLFDSSTGSKIANFGNSLPCLN